MCVERGRTPPLISAQEAFPWPHFAVKVLTFYNVIQPPPPPQPREPSELPRRRRRSHLRAAAAAGAAPRTVFTPPLHTHTHSHTHTRTRTHVRLHARTHKGVDGPAFLSAQPGPRTSDPAGGFCRVPGRSRHAPSCCQSSAPTRRRRRRVEGQPGRRRPRLLAPPASRPASVSSSHGGNAVNESRRQCR